jgi:hypothetical protein
MTNPVCNNCRIVCDYVDPRCALKPVELVRLRPDLLGITVQVVKPADEKPPVVEKPVKRYWPRKPQKARVKPAKVSKPKQKPKKPVDRRAYYKAYYRSNRDRYIARAMACYLKKREAACNAN